MKLETNANERVYALKEMRKIAGKYFPEIDSLLYREITAEREKVKNDIVRRKRVALLKEKGRIRE